MTRHIVYMCTVQKFRYVVDFGCYTSQVCLMEPWHKTMDLCIAVSPLEYLCFIFLICWFASFSNTKSINAWSEGGAVSPCVAGTVLLCSYARPRGPPWLRSPPTTHGRTDWSVLRSTRCLQMHDVSVHCSACCFCVPCAVTIRATRVLKD